MIRINSHDIRMIFWWRSVVLVPFGWLICRYLGCKIEKLALKNHMFKVNNIKVEQFLNEFSHSNKDIRVTSLILFWCLHVYFRCLNVVTVKFQCFFVLQIQYSFLCSLSKAFRNSQDNFATYAAIFFVTIFNNFFNI